MTMTFKEHPQRAILETCDLWDTDYISGNWEQQSKHSQWALNKEWQGQHSQFLRCLIIAEAYIQREVRHRVYKFDEYSNILQISVQIWMNEEEEAVDEDEEEGQQQDGNLQRWGYQDVGQLPTVIYLTR